MKNKLIAALVFMAVVFAVSARMTDIEVLDYIETQSSAGKSEQVIARELLMRGVSPEQVERIKTQFESRQRSSRQLKTVNATEQIEKTRSTRTSRSGKINSGDLRNTNRYEGEYGDEYGDDEYVNGHAYTDQGNRTTREQNRRDQNRRNNRNNRNNRETNELTTGALDQISRDVSSSGISNADTREVFGHNVFSENRLTFAPGENVATPQNYTLGPGDEVIIDLWGENEEHLRQTISPEGSIMVAQLGPIYLSGNTVQQANKLVRERFARKYGGVADSRSDVNVTLGQTRSIQVDVMGEVAQPGTFQLSPFATVFNALYNAGGINDIGTLRNIEVLRNGKRVSTVDIYDYLFKGRQTGNIRLQEGDVIIVPPYSELVSVDGNVKRPMYYEIKPGETVGTVIDYAGGFTGDAYSDMVRLARRNGRENELVNVEKGNFKTYRLRDGDVVTVGTILDRYSNRVELRGAVERPGMYALGTDIFTVRDLINKADGLMNDAYKERAMLYRETPDMSLEVEAIDLGAIMSGAAPDIELRRNDMLIVSSVQELNDRGDITIQGEVARPGIYPYAANSTVEDLIVQAGGLLQGASTARVDVARRITDPTAVAATDCLSETFTLSIENGLMARNDSSFRLQPYDVITVRRSPGYQVQEFVTIGGEVAFVGPYSLQTKNERISSIISRAGGVTPHAYIRGASLIRKMTEEEIKKRDEAIEMARRTAGNDSINIEMMDLSEVYNVGIELDKALANPGGVYDVVLKEGDQIFIPETVSTVSIAGEVMQPNTVTFEPGKKVKDYINSAGGYSERANKRSAYVVYMNGNIRKVSGRTKVEPGCQIIVPTRMEKKNSSFAEIMGYISSFTSLGVMAASIASLLKK